MNLAQLPAEGPELLRCLGARVGTPWQGALSFKVLSSPSSCDSVLSEAHKEVSVAPGEIKPCV